MIPLLLAFEEAGQPDEKPLNRLSETLKLLGPPVNRCIGMAPLCPL
jgi:hypothetical protein